MALAADREEETSSFVHVGFSYVCDGQRSACKIAGGITELVTEGGLSSLVFFELYL